MGQILSMFVQCYFICKYDEKGYLTNKTVSNTTTYSSVKIILPHGNKTVTNETGSSTRSYSSIRIVPHEEKKALNMTRATDFPSKVTNTFGMDCMFEGYKVCCSALELENNRLKKYIPAKIANKIRRRRCIISKRYFPSPYELQHISKAQEFMILDKSERKSALLDFMTSEEEIEASIRWLARVEGHMNGESTASEDDFKYLSYFNITEECVIKRNKIRHTYKLEWIEPLTMHARHPFSFQQIDSSYRQRVEKYNASHLNFPFSNFSNVIHSNLITTDHILLKNITPRYIDQFFFSNKGIQRNNFYLFDAGSSRFESSLLWLSCAYHKNGVDFDRLFAWEKVPHEPNEFWKKVPPRWKNHLSFFNTPISADVHHPDNPLEVLRNLGVQENDFVAFKMDIDTFEVEIPIVLQLNSSRELAGLVDEFFFELHFQCEFVGPCCWYLDTDVVPDKILTLELTRPGALKLFSDLRYKGIRAHFWP